MAQKKYIVAAIHDWNRVAFEQNCNSLPGEWVLIDKKEGLTPEFVASYEPRYIFFPHWSWKVPKAILDLAECVCFHMADVPYGRGGSPLQNLIVRGHQETKLSALRMVEELDAGPVYLKKDLSLQGAAHEIYKNAGLLTYDLIREIVANEMAPSPQQGEITIFARRTPDQSRVDGLVSPDQLYDHIRMLDAPGYPHAFLDCGQYVIELTNASKNTDDQGRPVVETKAVFRLKPLESS